MNKLLVSFALAAAITAAPAATPVFAQSDFGLGAAVTACTNTPVVKATCEAAVAQYIKAVRAAGLSPKQTDDLLADLVTALGDSAVGLPKDVRTLVAAVIREIGGAFNDKERGVLVASIADAVADGTNGRTGVTRTNVS